jgi:hypothetical protein
VFAAVTIVPRLVSLIVPVESYWSFDIGARNIRPLRRRPPTMAPVPHARIAPTPAAYEFGPVQVTLPGSLSVHPPVKVPVAESITSPDVGKDQLSEEGKKLLMLFIAARAAASWPETESSE